MKKRFISFVLALLMLCLPALSVYADDFSLTIEEIEYASQGKIVGTGNGYYVLERQGKTCYVDKIGKVFGEYCLVLDYCVDLTDFKNGTTDEFLGVKAESVVFTNEDMYDESLPLCLYLVTLPDRFSDESVLEPWANNEHILSYTRNAYNMFPDGEVKVYSAGDTNRDDSVDVFDYLLVKSICLETHEPTTEESVRADINLDGTIDLFDYMEIKAMCYE